MQLKGVNIETAVIEKIAREFVASPGRRDALARELGKRKSLRQIMRGFSSRGLQPPSRPFYDLVKAIDHDVTVLQLMADCHDSLEEPATKHKLGAKRIAEMATEKGPFNTFWLAAFHKQSTLSGLSMAIEIICKMPEPQAAADSRADSASAKSARADDRVRELQAEVKELRKEIRTKNAEARRSNEKLASGQSLVSSLRGDVERMKKQYAQADSRAAEAKKEASIARMTAEALKQEARSAADGGASEREIELTVQLTDASAERDDLAEQLSQVTDLYDKLTEEHPRAPEFPDLPMIRGVLVEKLRAVSTEDSLRLDLMSSLIATIQELDRSIDLDSTLPGEEPETGGESCAGDPTTSGDQDGVGAQVCSVDHVKESAPAELVPSMPWQDDPAISAAFHLRSAENRMEKIEAALFPGGSPGRLVIDGHNLFLNKGFNGSEPEHRNRLIDLTPHLADRLGSYVLTMFDTIYKSQQINHHNSQVIYFSKGEGGADERIYEELEVPRENGVMVITDDREIIDTIQTAKEEGQAVGFRHTAVFRDYLEALRELLELQPVAAFSK